MNSKDKIKILREAKKILKIGKPCEDMVLACCVCRAYLAISVIDDHIDQLKYEV